MNGYPSLDLTHLFSFPQSLSILFVTSIPASTLVISLRKFHDSFSNPVQIFDTTALFIRKKNPWGPWFVLLTQTLDMFLFIILPPSSLGSAFKLCFEMKQHNLFFIAPCWYITKRRSFINPVSYCKAGPPLWSYAFFNHGFYDIYMSWQQYLTLIGHITLLLHSKSTAALWEQNIRTWN